MSDILQAIELIEDFTKSITSYTDYVSDLKTQSAVERQLGIIGEAVNKFEILHPEESLDNARKIDLISTYKNTPRFPTTSINQWKMKMG